MSVTPTLGQPPLLIGTQGSHQSFDALYESILNYVLYTAQYNATGHLTISRRLPAMIICRLAAISGAPAMRKCCWNWPMNWRRRVAERKNGRKYQPDIAMSE